MRNRTKNHDLRRTLDRTVCYLEASPANALTVDSTQYNNYKTAQRPLFTSNDYDSEDAFRRPHLDNTLQEFEAKTNQEANRELVNLLTLDVNHLPCEPPIEPTELPWSRESVDKGLGLSGVFSQFSASPDAIKGNLLAICMLAIAARLVIT